MFPVSFSDSDQHPYGGLNPYSAKNFEVSKALTNLTIQYGNLKSAKNIVDLGCGTGRILFHLKDHIKPSQYVGVDCNKQYLRTLQEVHGEEYRTIHINANNPAFNPDGDIEPRDFRLPLDDNSHKLIIGFALFNHLSLAWVSAYLNEINRILTSDGLFLSTWFLLSHFYAREKHNLHNTYQFNYIKQQEYHIDSEHSYRNVAFSEGDIRNTITNSDLRIVEPIRYGQWVNGPSAVTGHDFIIMRKRV